MTPQRKGNYICTASFRFSSHDLIIDITDWHCHLLHQSNRLVMASQPPQTQSYSYNYSYSWQTNQGPVNTVSGGGQTSQPPPTWPQPSPSEPAKEQDQPTVTGEKSDEAPPPPPPSSSQIGAGFDHTYLRSIEGILRLISIVSLHNVLLIHVYGLLCLISGRGGGFGRRKFYEN